MAGITGDGRLGVLTVEICFVYFHCHQKHFAGRPLHLLIVFFTVDLPGHSNVAVDALHTKRISHEMHRGIELVDGQILQDLDILELLGRFFHRRRLDLPPRPNHSENCVRAN